MFYFNLKGVEEDLFRQGMAGVEHIVINGYEYWDRWNDAKEAGREFDYASPLYFETLCGRKLKFNSDYSRFRRHAGPIRNACEYCATEYEPDGPSFKERQREQRERDNGGLPF